METEIFTCKYFKFGRNTTGLSQSHLRNFLACSINTGSNSHDLDCNCALALRGIYSEGEDRAKNCYDRKSRFCILEAIFVPPLS